MRVKLSPYNSPFIPAGEHDSDIYWLGLQFQSLPHDAHVYQYLLTLPPSERISDSYREWLLRQTFSDQISLFTNEEIADLELAFFEYGIQAAGRRIGRCD